MKKRLLPALLAAVMILTLLPAALAAPAPVEDVAQVLAALDIMTGDQYGNLMLDRTVTRAEFTKLSVAASPMGKNVGAATTVSPYPDVPYTAWEAPYVEAAVAAGLVKGNLYGYFEPEREITLKEGVTIVLRLLGYADSDFSGVWPTGQMTLYRNLDLDEGIAIGPDSNMTRQDAMYLFYNLLTAQTKQGQTYLNLLGHSLNAAGEIDRVALINSAMNGPVVMAPGWESKVNFDVSTARVTRKGQPSSLSALQAGDVIYWSKSMRQLWAYADTVTGLYQAVSPNPSSPTAVTVAGKTYPIETADAAYALSNLGTFKVGDTVTLLLGRDGGVAAVTNATTFGGTLMGVVSAVTTSSYTDANGHSYDAKTILLTATDGNSYTYPVEAGSTLKAGHLVQVSSGNSGVEVKRLIGSSVTGKVSADGTKIGSTPLDPTVEILDVSGSGAAVRIYPSRLAGMTLDRDDVLYYRTNASGEIDRLILDDATGDVHAYGVLTKAQETDMGVLGGGGVYQFDVGGQGYVYSVTNKVLRLEVGPVKVEGPLQSPEKLSKLTAVKLSSLDATTLTTKDNVSWPMWDGMAVYEQTGSNTYTLTSAERVRSGYTLTGYYDAKPADGGRIRVVIAKAK